MTEVLAVANQKGGVAKTTTVHSLGVASAELGRRTLVVDLDPQACLTFSLGFDSDALEESLHDVFVRRTKVADVRRPVPGVDGLDLLPATIDLAGSEVHLLTRTGREHVLERALEPILTDYDLILIDCPPSLGVLTINGLTAADAVLIPLQCEALSNRGVGQLLETIEDVRTFANGDLKVRGVIATMYDDRTKHARRVLEEVESRYGIPVLPPPVKKSIRFAEAPARGKSILQHAPNSAGAQAYRDLAKLLFETPVRARNHPVTPESFDPLGKRALYWMPVDSQVAVTKEAGARDATSRGNDVPRPPTGRRRARPPGKHALYSTAVGPKEADTAGFTDTGTDPLPLRGLLAVECSACGSVTRVSVLDFLMLQFPFGAWVPGRTFDHRMTCPACRRRAWTSVTLSSSLS